MVQNACDRTDNSLTDWLFVHNPRTGGHSIREALGLGDVWPLHQPLAVLPRTGWSFGFVRNPWERLVSLYGLFRRYNQVAEEWEPWLMTGHRRLFDEPRDTIGLQRRPQSWWVDGCNFVGRYERLQEDFDVVCGYLGIERLRLPRLESNRPTDYRQWYDDEMREVVAERFAEDIERWRYQF